MRDGLRARFPQSAVTVGFRAKNGSGTLGVSAAVLLSSWGRRGSGWPSLRDHLLGPVSPRWPRRSLSQPLQPTKLLHVPHCAAQARGSPRMHVCARPQHPPVGQQEPGTCSPSSLWRGRVQGTDATAGLPWAVPTPQRRPKRDTNQASVWDTWKQGTRAHGLEVEISGCRSSY